MPNLSIRDARQQNFERLTPDPFGAKEAMIFMEGVLAGLVPIELSSVD